MAIFFFNDTATTEIYTLSLHDALPICLAHGAHLARVVHLDDIGCHDGLDRKSTRLNSSHLVISYAVFCLKKKQRYHKVDRITMTTVHTTMQSNANPANQHCDVCILVTD